MKRLSFLLFFATFSFALHAQSIVGTWSGNIVLPQGELPLVLHVSEEEGKLSATMDSPLQNAFGLPVDSISFADAQLRFAVNVAQLNYQGQLVAADSISGTFSQGGAQLPLGFKKGSADAPSTDLWEANAMTHVLMYQPYHARAVQRDPSILPQVN